MKKTLLLSLVLLGNICLYGQTITISNLLVENKENPLGLDTSTPRFTWIMQSEQRNIKQKAYRIQVSTKKDDFKSSIIWDSNKVESNQSVLIPYSGAALQSLNFYYWRVQVWDENGHTSKWSHPSYWQMGILNPGDWKAKWIARDSQDGTPPLPDPQFRTTFTTKKAVQKATAIITAKGMYEAYLNGDKIGDDLLTPGWTSYNKRLQYQVYDITKQIKLGENTVGALIGNGWYKSPITWDYIKNYYGDTLSLLLQIEVVYTDGTKQTFGTDDSWKAASSEVLSSEIYDGEILDAQKRLNGWKLTSYKTDDSWKPVKVLNYPYDNLIGTINEPVKKQETFSAQEIIYTPEGDTLIDFGQNLVGFVQLKVKGKKGDTITLRHAEVLDKNGNFYIDNLRKAQQKTQYVLANEDEATFEPHFTWQGFRYIKISGLGKAPIADNFTAIALYSDMKTSGQFKTSDALLNQLQHNIAWGQRGNFLDVPTDCPQRDERLGWTGDAQVFSNTAAFNMNVHNFFDKWLQDLAADQREDGAVPAVIPNVLKPNAFGTGSTGWADAATIIPWNMYVQYGDKGVLNQQYSSMKAWVDYMANQSVNYLWNTGAHYGDWLFYRPEDDNDGRSAITDKHLIAQCFFAHSTQLLINTAMVLGKSDDATKYTQLLKHIKDAFLQEYVTPSGRMVSSSQTAYVLALQFNMLPTKLQGQAAKRLVENIVTYDYHLTTGFLGTPYLCEVLSRFGYKDMAYTLLMQTTYPSWLYPVTQGATTIWERWDGQRSDGSFQTPGMNSFNHYAYGAIGNWMYTQLAGINSSEAAGETGYKHIFITPYVPDSYASANVQNQHSIPFLDEVAGSLDTYYGTISSAWKKKGKSTEFSIHIPVNTTAVVTLPFDSSQTVTEGGRELSRKDIQVLEFGPKNIVLEVGSGVYEFEISK